MLGAIVALGLAIALLTQEASAATYSWANAGTTWSTAANWGGIIGPVSLLSRVRLENVAALAFRHTLPPFGIDIHCGPPSRPSGGYVVLLPARRVRPLPRFEGCDAIIWRRCHPHYTQLRVGAPTTTDAAATSCDSTPIFLGIRANALKVGGPEPGFGLHAFLVEQARRWPKKKTRSPWNRNERG